MNVAAQLAQANAQLLATLTDEVTHQARLEVPDGAGGDIVTFAAGVVLEARVHPKTETPGEPAGREPALNVFDVVVPVDAAVAPGDRLVWRGMILVVRSVSASSWAIGQYCEAVQP